jgi:hypothetical protein
MKLQQLNENYIHKINIYPVITVIYDGQVQSEYEFEDEGQVVEVPVCLKPGDGIVGDNLVKPFMDKIKFDELGPLRDKAFEKFKSEKFLVSPDKLTKEKVQLRTTKAWAYATEKE